jgi:hypothetical protein
MITNVLKKKEKKVVLLCRPKETSVWQMSFVQTSLKIMSSGKQLTGEENRREKR